MSTDTLAALVSTAVMEASAAAVRGRIVEGDTDNISEKQRASYCMGKLSTDTFITLVSTVEIGDAPAVRQ